MALGMAIEGDSPDESFQTCECCEHLSLDCETFHSEHGESMYEGMSLCLNCFDSISEEYWQGFYNREPEINPYR